MINPLITLSIPVYNVAKYVERSLLSALNQTYDNLEILVVDDRGTDNSMEIVRKTIASHPRGGIVRILDHGINKGLGATRNTSIEHARGEYIFFMDSDDYISENCINVLYKAIDREKADVAIGSFVHMPVNLTKNYPQILISETLKGLNCYFDFYRSKDFYPQIWNKLFRLSTLKQNSIYCIPDNRNEDIYFCFQMIKAFKKIIKLSECTYYYTINDPNATTTEMRQNKIDSRRINQFIGILNEMYNYSGFREDVRLQTFFLDILSGLIRDIASASNLSNELKRVHLSQIPAYDEFERKEALALLPLSKRRYLTRNPIRQAKIDRIKNLFRKGASKIKRCIIRK